MEGEDELYNRQIPLDLVIPASVGVIGIGGVGAWVALDLALAGVPKLVVVDYDLVERSNLNRTPFRSIDIGKAKVEAITQIILERREECQILFFQERVQDLPEFGKMALKGCQYLIDCRDVAEAPPFGLKTPIVGGYDGFNITLDINPAYKIWGEGRGYRVIPSYLIPPQFLANLITLYLLDPARHQAQ